MKSGKKEWYYAQLGHQRGPVDVATIQQMIEKQELHLDEAKVWKEGMDEWLSVPEVKVFKSAVKSLRTTGARRETPAEKQQMKEAEAKEKDQYTGGISRLGFNLFFYVGWMVVFFGVMIVLKELQVFGLLRPREVDESLWIKYIPYAFLGVFSMYFVAMRMKNAGYSAGWVFALLVPFLNFWVILTSLCAPKNFKIRRQVGFAGVICFFLFLNLLGGAYFLNTRGVSIGPVGLTKLVMGKYGDLTHLQRRYSEAVQERAEMEAKRDGDGRQREDSGDPPRPSKRDMDMR